MATYVASLQQRVSDLTAREAQLEQDLAEVQKQQGITPIQPAPASAPPPPGNRLRAALYQDRNSYVNLRQGPGTSYPLLGTATRGNPDSEPMTVLAESGGWYQVRLPDARTGWVAGWLVEEQGAPDYSSPITSLASW